jgi:hypothetical protein
MTGAVWLITTRGPLKSRMNQLRSFEARFLCCATESIGLNGDWSGLRIGRKSFIGERAISMARKCPPSKSVPIVPLKEIDATDGDRVIPQQFDMRVSAREPRFNSVVLGSSVSRCKRPRSCQSRSLPQQLIPEPQPISGAASAREPG